MPRQLVPDQFVEIARLSDEERAKVRKAVTSNSNPEMAQQIISLVKAEYLSHQPSPVSPAFCLQFELALRDNLKSLAFPVPRHLTTSFPGPR
jgi:hypothetical protein